jgi:hypothetical protein
MNVKRLPNGNLLVPMRAEGPNGIIGDGAVEIGPDHPSYASWEAWLQRVEQEENEVAEDAKPKPRKRK